MTFWENERRLLDMVYALTRDQPPQYNIAPLLEVVRKADALGFAVVNRAPDKASGDT